MTKIEFAKELYEHRLLGDLLDWKPIADSAEDFCARGREVRIWELMLEVLAEIRQCLLFINLRFRSINTQVIHNYVHTYTQTNIHTYICHMPTHKPYASTLGLSLNKYVVICILYRPLFVALIGITCDK